MRTSLFWDFPFPMFWRKKPAEPPYPRPQPKSPEPVRIYCTSGRYGCRARCNPSIDKEGKLLLEGDRILEPLVYIEGTGPFCKVCVLDHHYKKVSTTGAERHGIRWHLRNVCPCCGYRVVVSGVWLLQGPEETGVCSNCGHPYVEGTWDRKACQAVFNMETLLWEWKDHKCEESSSKGNGT